MGRLFLLFFATTGTTTNDCDLVKKFRDSFFGSFLPIFPSPRRSHGARVSGVATEAFGRGHLQRFFLPLGRVMYLCPVLFPCQFFYVISYPWIWCSCRTFRRRVRA